MIFDIVNTISYLAASFAAGWAWPRLYKHERWLAATVWLATIADLSGHLVQTSLFWVRLDLNMYVLLNLAIWLWYFHKKQLLGTGQAITLFSLSVLAFMGEWWFMGHFVVLRKAYIILPVIILMGATNIVAKLVTGTTGTLLTNFLFVFLMANIINSPFEILNNSLAWWLPLNIKTRVALHMIYCWINDFTYLIMAYSFLCLKWNKKYFN